MKLKSTAEMDCSIARTLDIVGEWWTLLIVRDLRNGVHRFDRLQTSLGIARNVLTARLAKLVEHGIVETRPYQERPLRHEYHLTEKGQALSMVLYALLDWGNRYVRTPDDGPSPVVVEHATCGSLLSVALVCPHCATIVPNEEKRIVRNDPAEHEGARTPSTLSA